METNTISNAIKYTFVMKVKNGIIIKKNRKRIKQLSSLQKWLNNPIFANQSQSSQTI